DQQNQNHDQIDDRENNRAPHGQHNLHQYIHGVCRFLRAHDRQQPLPSLQRPHILERHHGHQKIPSQHVDDRKNRHHGNHHKCHQNPSPNQRSEVVLRLLKPPRAICQQSRNSCHYSHHEEGSESERNHPNKIPPSCRSPSPPPFAQPALPANHRVQ